MTMANADKMLSRRLSTSQTISNPYALIEGLGHCLMRLSLALSFCLHLLIYGSHIEKMIVEAHERSRQTSDLSDLSAIVALDINICRLR